jgi:prolyl 4-hydroxylase
MRIHQNILIIPAFLSPEECDGFIRQSEQSGYEAATIETEKGTKLITEVRNNERVLYRNEGLATELWNKLSGYAPSTLGNSEAIGLNELFRFYKYGPGQKFKRHIDESYIRNEEEASYFTFMMYLNDSYEGGETVFDDVTIKGEKGMGLIFLHALPHKGKEVLSGVKYVLRTDIMYRLTVK